jgi:hypothetical protein
VLAGVAELVAEYRRTSRLRHVVDGAVTGSPDALSDDRLHDEAWPLVQPVLDGPRREAADRVRAGTSPTIERVRDVVGAATEGRVEALFVPDDLECWGRVEGGAVVEHDERRPGDRDLCELAAIDTIRHRGVVFTVPAGEIPGDGQVAAILRF